MRALRSRHPLTFVFLAALYVCSGCVVAPLRTNVPGQASCDGILTQVDGRTMHLNSASTYYRQHDADDAATMATQAQRMRQGSRYKWLFFSAAGAVIGAIAGGAAPHGSANGSGVTEGGLIFFNAVFGALVGFGVGTPVGIGYSISLKTDSKVMAIHAAQAYNAHPPKVPEALPPSQSLPGPR